MMINVRKLNRIFGVLVVVAAVCANPVRAAQSSPGSGVATMTPTLATVATPGKWSIEYSAVDNFTNGTIQITIPPGWTAPQDGNPTAAGYVTVTSEHLGANPTLSISGQVITITVVDLPKPKTVVLVYGDDSGGANPDAKATPPTTSNPAVQFPVGSDPTGTAVELITASPTVDLQPGPIVDLDFTNVAFVFQTTSEGGPYSVVAKDTYGNSSPVGSNQQINLSTTSSDGTFSVLGGGAFSPVTNVTMTTGTHTVTFFYRDTAPGTPTLTASAGGQPGWGTATQMQSVNPGPPEMLELSPASTSVTAGNYVTLTIDVVDLYGNATDLTSARSFLLTSSATLNAPASESPAEQPSGDFYLPGDHDTPITTLLMQTGEQTAQVDFSSTDANGGNSHLIIILNDDPPPLSGSTNVTVQPGAIDGTASTVAASSPVTAGGSSPVTVTVTDTYGNPKSGVTVTLDATGNANPSNPGAPTNGTGQATGSVTNTTAESVTVSAWANGVPLLDTAGVVFTPGAVSAAKSLVDAASPIVADNSTQSQITVTAKDTYENPISGLAVTLSRAPVGQGETLTQPPGLTDSNGHAYGYLRSSKTGSWTVNASISGTPATDTAVIQFAPGEADRFEWSFAGGATAGVFKDVTLTVRDALNNVVTDYADTVFLSTTAPTAEEWGVGGANGVLGTKAGNQWYYVFDLADTGVAGLRVKIFDMGTFTLGAVRNLVQGTSASLNVDHNAATQIAIVSGNGQTAQVNTLVSSDLVVLVEDDYDNPVDGASVTFDNITGGGWVDVIAGGGVENVATSAANGEARCEDWRLGQIVGTNTTTARIAAGASVVFSADGTPGPGESIEWTTTSQSVTVGTSIPVGAILKDAFGNIVPGVLLTISITDAADGLLKSNPADPNPTTGGTISRQGTTDSDGKITVLYEAPGTAGLQDIVDATGGNASYGEVADLIFTSVASGATKLLITDLNPTTSPAGQAFSFKIKAVDGNNNLDPTNTSTVDITPEAGSGLEFSLTGSAPWTVTQVTLVGGQKTVYGRGVTFGTWSFTVDDVGPLLAPDTENVQITSAGVDHYDVSAPGSVTAGANFDVTVVAYDQYDNVVTSANNNVILRPVDPVTQNLISPNLSDTVATLAAGRVVVAESYNLARSIKVRVRDSNSKVGYSGTIVVNPATEDHIVPVSGDLTGIVAGSTVQHTAEVQDVYNNPVAGVTVSFSAPTGGGSVSPPSALTGGNGRVSFNHTTGTTAGSNTARATILDGNPPLHRAEWSVQTIASGIDYYLFTLDKTTWTANELVSVSVKAYDVNDNPVDDDTTPVQLSSTTGNVQYTLASGTLTNGSFSTTAKSTVAGQTRLIVSTNGGEPRDTSGVVTVVHGTAYEVVKLSGDGTIAAGGTQTLRVEVDDAWGNRVENEGVVFVITSSPGGATLVPANGITSTDGNGEASVDLHTSTTAGANVVRASIKDGNPPALETKTFTVNTTAGTIAKYDVVTPVTDQRAGRKVGFTVRALDSNNNLVDDDVTQVTLSLAKGTGGVFDQNPVTLQNGTFVDSVRTNTAPQTLQIRAQDPSAKFGLSPDITIRPNYASGPGTITATANRDTITADGTSTSALTSSVIRDAYNNIVETGTFVTVATNLGTITSSDADPGTPGTIERATNAGGQINFTVQSGTTPGPATVSMASVLGTATGTKQIIFAPKPVIANPRSLSPNVATPGQTVGFAVVVDNTSLTGVTLSTATTFFFTDGPNDYTANLASATYVDGLAPKTLIFANTLIPSGMAPGLYTPTLSLAGTDEFDFSFSQALSLPANSLRVSAIEIKSVTPETSVVSRGQTKDITVAVENKGPIAATIESVTFTFQVGNQHFSYQSVLSPSVNIPGTTTTNIIVPVTVLPSAPVGNTTIDAAISGTVSGTPVSDPSVAPYPLANWDIRAGAQVSYIQGSLTPMTVSRGRTYSFKVGLINGGDTTVELKTPQTTLSFTDGVTLYIATLKQNEALGAGASKVVEFNAVQVPEAMQANSNYEVALHLEGLENLEPFLSDISTSPDLVRVVTPANVSYVPGSLTPTVVFRTISTGFTLQVSNSGTAEVELTPGSTTFSFGSGPVYNATLNPAGGTTILPAGTTTLTFISQVVNTAAGVFTPQLHLVGTENTLSFDQFLPVSNQVTVQEPAAISIQSIDPSQDSITKDQAKTITMTMKVTNSSSTDVRFDSATLTFLLNGVTDLTNRFVVTPPTRFVTNGTTLPSGETDSLVFTVADNTGNSMTVGSYIVQGSLCVTNVVGGQQVCVNTSGGGWASLLVQNPGVLDIRGIVPSQTSVTLNQTQPWTAEMTVKNIGVAPAADVALDLGASSTFVSFNLGTGWVSALQTPGPIVLGQNESTTLVFNVSQSGNTAGTATIDGEVRGIELNSDVQKTDQTPPGAGSILVQTPAILDITNVLPSRGTVTENQTTSWTIAVTVENTGGAAVDLSNLAAETYIEFPTAVPVTRVTGPTGGLSLPGGGTTQLTFTVSPTPGFGGVPGSKTFDVRVQGKEGNTNLVKTANASGSVVVDLHPDPLYVATSFAPISVKAGDIAHFEVEFSVASGASTVDLNPAQTQLTFSDGFGHSFPPFLDPDSATTLQPGGTTKIWFEQGVVPIDFVDGTYPVTVKLRGTENGNVFSKDFNGVANVEIRPAATIVVDTMIASRDRASASQDRDWTVRMAVSNTGGGDVRVQTGTGLVLRIGGVNVTGQYTIDFNPAFEQSGSDILAAGSTDILVFTILHTGTATGSMSVYGVFVGKDIESNADVGDDTFDNGWTTVLVERPGVLRVTQTQPSRATVTQGQTTSWNTTATVQNTGEAAVRLTFDATRPDIRFVPDSGFGWTRPAQLQGGGTLLAGGATGTLVFPVSPTGTQAGTPVIHAVVAGVDTNSLNVTTWDTETNGSGSGSIVVQNRGRVVVKTTTIASPNPLEVNLGQQFPVRVEISNDGGADLKDVSYRISTPGGSTFQNDTLAAPSLAAGATVIDTFLVTADNTTGSETFTVDVVTGTDVNSNQTGLLDIGPHIDQTATVEKVSPSNLVVDSVTPSQPTVTKGQTTNWTVDVAVTNAGGAALDVVNLNASDLAFSLGAQPLTDYVVVPPARFVNRSGLTLGSGENDTLRYTIDVTGGDAGTVTIRAAVDWKDKNDETTSSAENTGTVTVVNPSGFLITETVADPTTAPNSPQSNLVLINTGQQFLVNVKVQNSNGGGEVEDLENVRVRLWSDHPTNPVDLTSAPVEILRNQDHTFVFDVSLAPLGTQDVRQELLTSAITSARSKQTGQNVTPNPPVDNQEFVIVQQPAELAAIAQAPDTVSTDQEFTLMGIVANNGVAAVDDTGKMALVLPPGFVRVGAVPDTVGLVAGQPVNWRVRAPSNPILDQILAVKITTVPNDKNIDQPAAVTNGGVGTWEVDVLQKAGFSSPTLAVFSPAGATDDTLSTQQQFTLQASVVAEQTTFRIKATLVLDANPGFEPIDPLEQNLGDGTGGEMSRTWRLNAPSSAGSGQFHVEFQGFNQPIGGEEVSTSTPELVLEVVDKARLRLDALIARPAEARDGKVAIGSRFEIDGAVSNLGQAGIDPANATVRINFSQAAGYSLYEGTAERSFAIDETITWVVNAPSSPTPARNIVIEISGVPADENTGAGAFVELRTVPIPVQTDNVFITADNVSQDLGIDSRVVPRGTSDVEMLGVELANSNAIIGSARIETIAVSLLDGSGSLAGSPSQTLREFYALVRGHRVDGQLNQENPVVFDFTVVPGGVVLPPAGSDSTASIVFAVSVLENSALDEILISIENADDFVIRSSGGSGPMIPVVDKDNPSGSITGRLRSQPLVILSNNFEEYAHNYPNPFRAGAELTRIAYKMDGAGSVSVRIFDVMGEPVYEKQYASDERQTTATGAEEVTWDGKNMKGEVVRNGIYICQLQAGGKSVKIRIAVAK